VPRGYERVKVVFVPELEDYVRKRCQCISLNHLQVNVQDELLQLLEHFKNNKR